jgi:glycosyltransferase involved in cell wall biosynthesis
VHRPGLSTDEVPSLSGRDHRSGAVIIMGEQFGFPNGTGASARVLAFAQGLRSAGVAVKVLCVEPTESGNPPLNSEVKGVFRGIPFEYTYGSTTRLPRGTRRRILKVAKWGLCLRAALRWRAESGELAAVIVYSRSLAWMATGVLAGRLTGAVCVHDDSEMPFVWRTPGPWTTAKRLAYERSYRLFDGCIAISTYLRSYCTERLRCGENVLLVPILVDVSEFEGDGDGDAPVPGAVMFCGSLDHGEVRTLLQTFAMVARELPETTLWLVGGAKRAGTMPALRGEIEQLDLTGRVRFTGRVGRTELPTVLRSASVLVLPRSAGPHSLAGLPTKVAEYLATGRPVVVTTTGDIPRYLRDGHDAYLVPPDDVQAFADRLRYVLEHPDEAAHVGEMGKRTATSSFSPLTHGQRMREFIEELRSQRRARGR